MKPFHFLTLSAAVLLFANTNAYAVDADSDTTLHLMRRGMPSDSDATVASDPLPAQSASLPANADTVSMPSAEQVGNPNAAAQPANEQASPVSAADIDTQQKPELSEGQMKASAPTNPQKANDTQQGPSESALDVAPSPQQGAVSPGPDSNTSFGPETSIQGEKTTKAPKAKHGSKGKGRASRKAAAATMPTTEEQNQPPVTEAVPATPLPPSPSPMGQTTMPSSPAAPTVDGPHPLVVVQDEDNFCMFLPPKPGMDVATNEDFGIPFCSRKGMAGDNQEFPEDFVTKKHVESNSAYIQVTGYIDPTKYGLLPTDQGGQYDNHGNGKPIGAQCQGWKYFVNLLEPANSRFCIRCCKSKADCNTGRSEYGCPRVVPGDYTDFDLVADVLEALAAEDTPTTPIPLGQHVQSFIDTVMASGDANVSKRAWSAFINGLMNQYVTHQDQIRRVDQTTAGVATQDDWVKYCNDLKGIVDLPSENM
ncbi:hypothetical protein BX666DRAFT_1997168 [Dichotomocladium elegans]|nr:hypothetical protein BX666DRAFT_1997168 [Dichotomocladium elegans]